VKELRFKINYQPHAGQLEVLQGIIQSQADVIVVVAARGWGKTLFSTCNIVIPAMLKIPHCQVMWVAPSYKICRAPIDDVWKGINEQNGERYVPEVDEKTGYRFWDYKKGDMELHLFNESKMFMRSAENPNSIVAKGYNLIVIDEAALISKEVFMQHILPTARRANCKIVVITTPRGRNWVWELFKDGKDASKKAYYSTQQPWFKRPDYPELLKRLMLDTPEHIRRQEYFAEFLEGGAGTFKNLDAIFRGAQINFPSDQQHWYANVSPDRFSKELFVVGADFAKSNDYTVLTAFSQQKKDMVGYERFNKTDYKIVLERIRRMSQKFGGAEVIFDNTGVGSGLADFLSSDLSVHPFTLTNQSKNEIINKLIVSCDYGNISMPNIVTMRNEFEMFSYELTRTGKLSYNAPDGKHDDCVISVALSNWYAGESIGSVDVHSLENFFNVMGDSRRPKSFYDEMAEDND
jgi:hypothetical protein